METDKASGILTESHLIFSAYLEREVMLDIYFPTNVLSHTDIRLLLINDGQNLPEMKFDNILEELYQEDALTPLFCVGIHCGKDRKNEYGTVDVLDYKGRGTKAAAYSYFVFDAFPFCF